MTRPRYRVKGISDDVTTCEACGKENLKKTVALAALDADGNEIGDPMYYGTDCAGRALGMRGAKKTIEGKLERLAKEEEERERRKKLDRLVKSGEVVTWQRSYLVLPEHVRLLSSGKMTVSEAQSERNTRFPNVFYT